jgi:hypothetical protein
MYNLKDSFHSAELYLIRRYVACDVWTKSRTQRRFAVSADVQLRIHYTI